MSSVIALARQVARHKAVFADREEGLALPSVMVGEVAVISLVPLALTASERSPRRGGVPVPLFR